MPKTKNENKKNSKNIIQLITLAIGIILLAIGCIMLIVESRTLEDRQMALATVIDESVVYPDSFSKEGKPKTFYTMSYYSYNGEGATVTYTREKAFGENLEYGNQFVIYYSIYNGQDIIEYNTHTTFSILLIIVGISIFLIDIFYMSQGESKESDKRLKRKLKKLDEVNFSVNKDMLKEAEEEIKKKQQEVSLVDDEMTKKDNLSLLEKRMKDANATQNQQLNTGANIYPNAPVFTGPVYGAPQQPYIPNNGYGMPQQGYNVPQNPMGGTPQTPQNPQQPYNPY